MKKSGGSALFLLLFICVAKLSLAQQVVMVKAYDLQPYEQPIDSGAKIAEDAAVAGKGEGNTTTYKMKRYTRPLAISDNDKYLFTSSGDIFDLTTEQYIKSGISFGLRRINDAIIGSDGSSVICSGEDYNYKNHVCTSPDKITGKVTTICSGRFPNDCNITSSGNYVLVGDLYSPKAIYNLQTSKFIRKPREYCRSISANGITISHESDWVVRDSTDKIITTFPTYGNFIYCKLSRYGDYAYFFNYDSNILIKINVFGPPHRQAFRVNCKYASVVCCSNNSKYGVIGSTGCHLLYNLTTGKFICKISEHLQPLKFCNNDLSMFCWNESLQQLQVLDFSEFTPIETIENYINNKVSIWQEKGEFERTAEYQERISDVNRKKAIAGFQNEIVSALSEKEAKKYSIPSFTIGSYDADNGTYLITAKGRSYVIQVPNSDARKFKENFTDAHVFNHKFILTTDGLKLSSFDIVVPETGSYSWNHLADNPYQQTSFTYNFDKVELNIPADDNIVSQKNFAVKEVKIGKSEVDTDIPAGSIQRKNTFVLIIGNEHYKNEIAVTYALNDAEVFKKYAEATLSIPAQNIHFAKDASYGDMLGEIDWLSEVGKVYGADARLIFYYAGHGMPDETTKIPYMLPVDGSASRTKTAISLGELYSKLSAGQTQSVTVLLDACFSGAAREGMLADGRGVVQKPKEVAVPSNAIVISAVTGAQTAHPYKSQSHGMFTYYLLKTLKETKGKISYGELADAITTEVQRQSVVINNKLQNPQVQVGKDLEEIWKQKQF